MALIHGQIVPTFIIHHGLEAFRQIGQGRGSHQIPMVFSGMLQEFLHDGKQIDDRKFLSIRKLHLLEAQEESQVIQQEPADSSELRRFQMGLIQQRRNIDLGKDQYGNSRIGNGQFTSVDHQPGLILRRGKIIGLYGAQFAPTGSMLEHILKIFLFQLMAKLQGIDDKAGKFFAPSQEQQIPFQLPVHHQILFIQHVKATDHNGQFDGFPAGSFIKPFAGQFPQRLGNPFFAQGIH